MKRKYVLKNKFRFSIFIVLAVLTVIITVFSAKVYGFKEQSYRKVVVESGDTLWDIAMRYNKGKDIREFIFNIKRTNNLANSEVYSGLQLMIPVE